MTAQRSLMRTQHSLALERTWCLEHGNPELGMKHITQKMAQEALFTMEQGTRFCIIFAENQGVQIAVQEDQRRARYAVHLFMVESSVADTTRHGW